MPAGLWVAQFLLGLVPGMGWQNIIGKTLLLFVSVVELALSVLGLEIQAWMILLPAITQVAQWFLAFIPGTKWQVIIGRLLLLVVSIVELVLAQLGVEIQLWLILAPMVVALAQYLISLVPVESST